MRSEGNLNSALRVIWLVFLCSVLTVNAEETKKTPAPSKTPTPSAKTLSEYAKRIKLKQIDDSSENAGTTIISNKSVESGSDNKNNSAMSEYEKLLNLKDDKAENEKRTKWRARYTEQQKRIEDLKKEIEDLNSEIPAIQNQFYSWDDPAYRDGVLKPKLDEAMKQREELQKQLGEEEPKLPQIIEDARRDGAEPGWFRNMEDAKKAPSPKKTPPPKS